MSSTRTTSVSPPASSSASSADGFAPSRTNIRQVHVLIGEINSAHAEIAESHLMAHTEVVSALVDHAAVHFP